MRTALGGNGRSGSRFVAGLSALGLIAGVTLAAPAQAAAATWAIRDLSATVDGTSVTVSYKVNAKTTRPKTRVCTLNGDPTRCGKLTRSTRRANRYTLKRTGLDEGYYRFRVAIRRTAAAGGGTVSRTARFAINILTCEVTNTTTGGTYVGDGANLQSAINLAAAGDTLNVTGTCVGNYSIDKSLTVAGPPTGTATLDGNQAGRVIRVDAGPVTLDNLTITGGDAPGVGGGIYSSNSGSTTTVTDSTITGNTADGGGGIFKYYGSLIVTDSTISDNTATAGDGGGLWNVLGGPLTVTNSTISDNTASDYGGGIYTGWTTTVTDSTITGNAANIGGGIRVSSESVTVNCSTVSGNLPDDLSISIHGSVTVNPC